MTAALAIEQTGPVALDDADLLAAIRTAYPRWQTEAPSLRQIREVAVCGQTKAIRLRDLLGTWSTDADQTAPTRPVVRPIKTFRSADAQIPVKEIADQITGQTPSSEPDQTVDLQTTGKQIQTADQTIIESETPVQTAPIHHWPVLVLALPAFVAVWSGWVGLGKLTGFGKVNLLPGIGDGWVLDTSITLPIGVEAYAAFALWVWLSGRGSDRARNFAKWSAIASLVIGAAGQIAYHLLTAEHVTKAPWPITMAVACLPVAVLGMGAALAHLVHADRSA